LASSARKTAPAYSSGLLTVISQRPGGRPTGTRPRTVILFVPYARCAEKVVELPRDEVVVRLLILTYFAAAAGHLVILAFLPSLRGEYLTNTVPESVSAEIWAA
jgi:hypothetical protein